MKTQPDPDLLPVGVVTCDMDARVTYLNRCMLDWLELDAQQDAQGQLLHQYLTPAGRIYFETMILPRLKTGDPAKEISLELCGASGARLRVHLTATVERAKDGTLNAIHGVIQDSTQRHLYEQQVLNMRRTSDAFAAVFKASPDVIMSVDTDLRIKAWNDAAERLLGFTAAEAIGRHNHDLIVPEEYKNELFDLRDSIRTGATETIETVRRHKDGSLIPVELNVAGYFDEAGEYAGAIGILRDIRKRKESEALIETLNREVLHRTKNLLAVVQGIASMTVRHSGPEDFMANFSQRLGGLSRSLSMLVDRNWGSVALRELIHQQLSYLTEDHSSRVTLDGPEVEIGAGMAEPIGMAFFELSTNAVKYGGLKHHGGRIEVRWEVVTQEGVSHLSVYWSETGVPDIKLPTDIGFGSALTGRLLEAATDGMVEVEFAPGGLQWRFEVLLDGLK